MQIRSPENGTQITQEQDYLLVSGKIASGANRSPFVDIFLVLDVSGSTAKYAEVDFPEVAELANFYLYPGKKGRYSSGSISAPLNKRNSIFAAEILASPSLIVSAKSRNDARGCDYVWPRRLAAPAANPRF